MRSHQDWNAEWRLTSDSDQGHTLTELVRRPIGSASSFWAVALISLVALVITRWRAMIDGNILGYDEALFLVWGQIISSGGDPFADAWINKPPLVGYLVAAMTWLVGDAAIPARVLQTGCIWGCALAVWKIAGRTRGNAAGALACVALVLSMTTLVPPGDRLSLVSENFFILPMTLSVTLLVPGDSRNGGSVGSWTVVGSGVMLGVAIQLRQNGLLLIPLLALAVLSHPCVGRSPMLRRRLGLVAIWSTCCLAAACLPYLPSLANGTLRQAVFWSWTWPWTAHETDLAALVIPGRAWVWGSLQREPVVLFFACVGVCVALTRAARRDEKSRVERWLGALVMLWFLCGVAMAVAGGKWYPHYLIMLVPQLCVLAGIGWAALWCRVLAARRWTRAVSVVCLGLYMLCRCVGGYQEAADDQWLGLEGPLKGPGSELLLEAVAENTDMGDRIFVLGSCPILYYRSQRLPAAPDFSGELLLLGLGGGLGGDEQAQIPVSSGGRTGIEEAVALGVMSADLVIDLSTIRAHDRGSFVGLGIRWGLIEGRGVEDFGRIHRVLETQFTRLSRDDNDPGIYLRVSR